MTDWLNDMLDSDAPAEVPQGFSDAVMSSISAESKPSVRASRGPVTIGSIGAYVVAASIMLMVGVWIGQGSRPMGLNVDPQQDAEMAVVDIDTIFANHELLGNIEIPEGSEDGSTDTSIEVLDFALSVLEGGEDR